MNSVDFAAAAKAAAGWWHSDLSDATGAGRMARAQLRRCDSAGEALGIEATHRLHAALGHSLRNRADRLALVAIALANLTEEAKATAPERMGEQVGTGARLPAMRFQTLLRIAEPAELIRPLRRALVQIERTAQVRGLARDLLLWNDNTRARWAFAYYGASLPPATTTSMETTS